jgi:hypothetical protein
MYNEAAILFVSSVNLVTRDDDNGALLHSRKNPQIASLQWADF